MGQQPVSGKKEFQSSPKYDKVSKKYPLNKAFSAYRYGYAWQRIVEEI
jgi:hypothetical protein